MIYSPNRYSYGQTDRQTLKCQIATIVTKVKQNLSNEKKKKNENRNTCSEVIFKQIQLQLIKILSPNFQEFLIVLWEL